MSSGSAKSSSGASSGRAYTSIPILTCDEFWDVVEANGGVTVSFEGAGSCLDGKEFFLPKVSGLDLLDCAWATGFCTVAPGSGGTPAVGVNICVSACGGHNPPCCLHTVQPGHVPIVDIWIKPSNAPGDSLFNQSMRGCVALSTGFPYTMQMCTDVGGGGAPVQNVESCWCLKTAPGGVMGRVYP